MRNIKYLFGILLFVLLSPGMAEQAVETAKLEQFTASQFKAAQQSNQRFLVVFHKKDCSRCARQQHILAQIAALPEFSALRILIVNFDNSETIGAFDVLFHDTLILFKGRREMGRSNGLQDIRAIKRQITK